MNKDRAVTYSLLAHIRSKSTLVKGPIDIFTPLIKRVLSKMNNDGLFSGKSILEIKNYSDKLYSLDFPIPVLEKILHQIASEINTEESLRFNIYQDKSFAINGYVFTEFEEEIRKHKIEIENLEELFKKFRESSGQTSEEGESIFKFIEKNKTSLSKYLSTTRTKNGEDFSIEAQFVDYFKKITPVYDLIKDIYLGSIIAGYIEYKTEGVTIDVELLLDTNFIIGVLDLNTPESMHTCSTLLKIAINQGYRCKVLNNTVEEIKALLNAKAHHFDKSFLQKTVYPEDIYNACERRGLNSADLERIADNLIQEVTVLGISIIYDTTKYENEARYSETYTALKFVRNSEKAALHDATAITYVRKHRGKNIFDFEKVNCWFVNNAISREGQSGYDPSGKQPEIIKADDLLNILWLSNPQSKIGITDSEMVDIGLSSLISLTLNESLPKTSIIRELDDNIHKYADSDISDTDIIRIATRITSKQLRGIEELNELAKSNKEEFVKRLQDEAKKQEKIENERLKIIEEAVAALSKKSTDLDNAKTQFDNKSKEFDVVLSDLKTVNKSKDDQIVELEEKLLKEKNDARENGRKEFYKKKLKRWRCNSWIEAGISFVIVIIGFVYILSTADWDFHRVPGIIKEFQKDLWISSCISIIGMFFMGVTLPTLYGKYRNHSNIENYKKSLEIPNDLKELK